MTAESPTAPAGKRRRIDRVTAACDFCKKRKVKCDGEQPCAYCTRKDRADTCSFTAPRRAGEGPLHSAANTPHTPLERRASHSRANSEFHGPIEHAAGSSSPTLSRDAHHEDTVVPREGRILRDAQGKLIFIGDCAPLSFLQTIRHLIASEVEPNGFPVQGSRDSIIEVARPELGDLPHDISIDPQEVSTLIAAYLVVTSGLVDLFDHDQLFMELGAWASGDTSQADDAAAAVFFLVLAIGAQESQEQRSEAWFTHARDLLIKHMCNSMNVATVQGFTLVAIYTLRAFQPNGAYLYFSLAARTAYAIGLHRTEVNASFGPSIKTMRDRIWKSLRVVDMLISTNLGRPPSTSDVDCTVKYSVSAPRNEVGAHVLDASVQIFMIIERVVVEVYSRKRISLQIADYVSRQLKGWASKWLQALSDIIYLRSESPRNAVIGSCSTLCSYYYGVMLLTRPFLIYELYEYMGASMKGGGTQGDHQNKRKYADAALDAAASFVDTLQAVIKSGKMTHRMPLIVSWLFTASLVLAVSILGRSGSTFERSCKASIRCLDFFGEVDPHARQYSLIVQSLLKTTTAHVKKREQQLRSQCKQASSQLFGMLSAESNPQASEQPNRQHQPIISPSSGQANASAMVPVDWTIYDADFFALPWPPNEYDQGLQDFLQPGTHNLDGASIADIPLFPIYDQQQSDLM
ncbi:hypothetical protein P280DRAFT_223030 [Massarina eburnea CBS 473.64]|uniref:Zn(2)-C6 fungal-type domain-containing protein n=1 Tax=Massarina eburnea CBS 473.64 TaxID=1395130 RepID=A0A6A6S9X1_9PLEO|nr:hypothetical protein P280DRAFT_223030 [Massarina eburnea CBS 473.64]